MSMTCAGQGSFPTPLATLFIDLYLELFVSFFPLLALHFLDTCFRHYDHADNIQCGDQDRLLGVTRRPPRGLPGPTGEGHTRRHCRRNEFDSRSDADVQFLRGRHSLPGSFLQDV